MNNCISGVLLIGTFSANTILGHIYRIYSAQWKLAVTVAGSTLLGHQTSIRKWPRQGVNSQRAIHLSRNTTQGGGCFWRYLHTEFGHCWVCWPLRGCVRFRGMMSLHPHPRSPAFSPTASIVPDPILYRDLNLCPWIISEGHRHSP